MTHELKVWIEFFPAIFERDKTFELRKNDRKFKVGDELFLREWNPKKNEYTGNFCYRNVDYILNGGQFGLQEGFVIMSIS